MGDEKRALQHRTVPSELSARLEPVRLCLDRDAPAMFVGGFAVLDRLEGAVELFEARVDDTLAFVELVAGGGDDAVDRVEDDGGAAGGDAFEVLDLGGFDGAALSFHAEVGGKLDQGLVGDLSLIHI